MIIVSDVSLLNRDAWMQNQSTLQVDLSAVEHNCFAIRSHIGTNCKFCAVVKADGYGLGAVRIGSKLSNHANMLAVYSADEAGALLSAGIQSEILVLAPVYTVDRFHPLYRGITTGRVHLVVHGADQLHAIMQMARRFGSVINVHIKVDTGLHRGGCDPWEAAGLIKSTLLEQRLKLMGIMTHFSSAVHDALMTRLQHDRIDKLLDSLVYKLPADCLVHEANSAAAVQWPWTHRNMVRVGLAWTGTVPAPLVGLEGFRPVVSWAARLAHVRSVRKGEHVGYGGTWIAKRNSTIGIIPVGYAAGYPMGVGADRQQSGAFVHVLCKKGKDSIGDAPVIGAICMDQIAIDLTDLKTTNIDVGCVTELLSARTQSKASLSHVAHVAGIVPHAVISRISTRVTRTYRSEGLQIGARERAKSALGM